MKTVKLSEICTISMNPENPSVVIAHQRESYSSRKETLTARVVNAPHSETRRSLCLTDFANGVDLNAIAGQLNAKLADISAGSVKPCVTLEALAEMEVEISGGE